MQRRTGREGDRWWPASRLLFPVAALLLVVGGVPVAGQAPEPRQATCDPLFPDTVRPGDLFACALDAAPGLLVIGSVQDDLRAEDAGTVYVFEGDAPPLRLAPESLGARDRFGYAVDVDRGGGRFVASSPFHDAAGLDAGAAWVYARGGPQGWEIDGRLDPGGLDGGLRPVDQFGYAVAVDGPWAAVGAPGDDRRADAAGGVYLFLRGELGWAPVARLGADDGAVGDGFGTSVALAGGLLLVGAPFRDAGGREAGAVYVFALGRDGGVSQVQTLTGDGGAGALFGHAVATDGVTAAVSARRESAPGDDAGAVYVYRRSGDRLVFEQRLEVPAQGVPENAGAGDELGTGLALDGDLLAAGARFDDVGAPDAGAVWTFRRGADGWRPESVLRAAEPGAGDEFGYAVALSGDRLVAGAYRDDDGGSDAGTACQLSVAPETDLSVEVRCQDAPTGGPVRWTVRVENRGPDAVPPPGALVTMPIPAALNAATATCTGPAASPCVRGGAAFTARPLLGVGESARFTLTARPNAGIAGRVRATAAAEPPDGVFDPRPGAARGSCTACVRCVADVGTGLTCPDAAAAGSPVSWTATVTNRGPNPVPAPGAAVTLTLPPQVAPASATCTTSAPGASPCVLSGGTFTSSVPLGAGAAAVYTVGATAPPTAAVLSPGASAALTAPFTDPDPTDDADACRITVGGDGNGDGKDFDLSITHPAPPQVEESSLAASTTVTFQLLVTNAADATATATAVRVAATTVPGPPEVTFTGGSAGCAAAPSGVVCTVGDLAPGQTASLELTYRVPPACPQLAAGLEHTATVSSAVVPDRDSGNDVSTRSAELPIVDPCPTDLRLTKSGPSTATAGGVLQYTLTVTNAGERDVGGATVLDDLPQGLTNATWSCAASGGAECGAAGSGDLEETVDLPADSSVTFSIGGTLAAGTCGEIVNSAFVAVPEGVQDLLPANNLDQVSTLVFPGSGVCAVKEIVSSPNLTEGSLIHYRVLVFNAGPGAVADGAGAEFVDTLPVGLTLVGASASFGTVSTAANTVRWDGTIPAGGVLEILIDATIDMGALGQTLCNQGEVTVPFVLTDDPAVPGNADPTCFSVACPIPTLSPLSLALLAVLLAAAGAFLLRRRLTTG